MSAERKSLELRKFIPSPKKARDLLAFIDSAEWVDEMFPEIQTEHAGEVVVVHDQAIVWSCADLKNYLWGLYKLMWDNPDRKQHFVVYVERPDECDVFMATVSQGAVSAPFLFFLASLEI